MRFGQRELRRRTEGGATEAPTHDRCAAAHATRVRARARRRDRRLRRALGVPDRPAARGPRRPTERARVADYEAEARGRQTILRQVRPARRDRCLTSRSDRPRSTTPRRSSPSSTTRSSACGPCAAALRSSSASACRRRSKRRRPRHGAVRRRPRRRRHPRRHARRRGRRASRSPCGRATGARPRGRAHRAVASTAAYRLRPARGRPCRWRASRRTRFEALALPGDQTVKSLLEAAGYRARLLRMSDDR